MQKWEYLTSFVEKYDDSTEKFDHWGKEGWELISVDDSVAYFKRPIEDEKDDNIYSLDGAGRMVVTGTLSNRQKPLIDAVGEPLDEGS